MINFNSKRVAFITTYNLMKKIAEQKVMNLELPG